MDKPQLRKELNEGAALMLKVASIFNLPSTYDKIVEIRAFLTRMIDHASDRI